MGNRHKAGLLQFSCFCAHGSPLALQEPKKIEGATRAEEAEVVARGAELAEEHSNAQGEGAEKTASSSTDTEKAAGWSN